MLCPPLVVAGALALVASASAQNAPQTLNAEKVPGAIKHAGTYHVSTGTWTRSADVVAGFGPDTIYSNTAASGYYSIAGGNGGFAPRAKNFDEGNLPSSANTNNPGNRDGYSINCVEIGYCNTAVDISGGWILEFYTSHAPCTINSTSCGTINAVFLPVDGCWTVALDLTGGNEFCLGADGGDGFDDDQDLDAFGWSFEYIGSGIAPAGFLLAGDPQSTDSNWATGTLPTEGTNTYFGPASQCSPEEATGLRTEDAWYLEDPNDPDPGGPNATSGCYFFGGYSNNNGCGGPFTPYASWHLELSADVAACSGCHDFLSVPNGCTSNPNSTGVNSTMVVTGSAAVADNDVTLTAAIPAHTFGFFITAQTSGFIQMPAGAAGNVCLGGNIGRFSDVAANSGPAGIIEISTNTGQWSLAGIPQGSGPYAAVAGGSAHFQCWHRDHQASGPTSNFTDGVVVTWQ